MTRAISLIVALLVLVSHAAAFAEWRVEFESKTVGMNQTGVTLGMNVYWDAEINLMVVPIVVREITPGSFWTGTLPCDTMRGLPQGVTWNWSNPGWPAFIQEVRPGSRCGEPVNEYDGISPDYFLAIALGVQDGTPAEPDGREVVTLQFDVTGQPGQFEFDTACIVLRIGGSEIPDLNLQEHDTPYTQHGPNGLGDCTFSKGVVTIVECDCSHQGDCDGNGRIDVADLAYLVAHAILNYPAPLADPLCPALNRGDWNADGRVNLVDIVSIVRYLFRHPAPGPVDPCPQ